MLFFALFLLAVWLVLVVAFKATAFFVHLLLFAAVLLAITWIVRKVSGHHTSARTP